MSALVFRCALALGLSVLFIAMAGCSADDDRAQSEPTHPDLILEREKKLSSLVGKQSYALEASGVALRNGSLYIVLDDATAIAVIDPSLTGGRLTPGEARDSHYEGITPTDATTPAFYVIEETDGHGVGTVVALDVDPIVATTEPTDVRFKDDNKGFEGIAFARVGGTEYLLALCEPNLCDASTTTPGGGRIKLLERDGSSWSSRATLNIPATADFADYSDLALWDAGDGSYIVAVTSQESSALWLGSLETQPWALVGPGRVLSFPRSDRGKVRYCEIEGVAFLDRTTLATVSDRTTRGGDCADTDESVHVFRIPDE